MKELQRNALKFFKDYNKTKLVAATKNLKTNCNFFVKETFFLLIRRTRRSLQIFKVDFDNIREILTFCVNFSYCKTISRGVLRTHIEDLP